MHFKEKTSEQFVLEIDPVERNMLGVALGRAILDVGSKDKSALSVRTDATRGDLEEMRSALRSVGALERPYSALIEIGPTPSGRYAMRCSPATLLVLVRALDELANGVGIPDWEFSALVGFRRFEIRDCLHEFHTLLVNRGKDLDAIKR